jgi:hypothetical protein
MIRRLMLSVVSISMMSLAVACGGNQNASQAPAAAAPAATPAAAAKPAPSLTLVEPGEGAMGGHIDTFRWTPVEGADGYVIKIVAVTGDRVVWESAPMAATEAHLPPTVALEPEVHTWSVTARKGSQILATSPTQTFRITP